MEIAGSSGVQLVAVTDKTMEIPYSSHDYVIADPRRKSSAMIVHDVSLLHFLTKGRGTVLRNYGIT